MSIYSIISQGTPSKEAPIIFPARVIEVILNKEDNPNRFKEYGEYASIGGVLFDNIKNPNPKPEKVNLFAKPLFPNIKTHPLKNEIVYVISLPNNSIQNSLGGSSYYYFNPINIWNSTHHNAIPDPVFGEGGEETQQDYQEVENGLVRKIKDNSSEIDLGPNFEEKLNIKPLQPYSGDVIYEGRWGNSLRFGSTGKNNPWSDQGDKGKPITIIRNGQHDDGEDNWVPQTEDINKDPSSIYITSTQKLPIEVSSKSYNSYQSKPTTPSEYESNQIILNSDRVLLNSKIDSVLLSANKSVNLNSVESVNVDSPSTIIQSGDVLLGDKDADEPIILGNKFLSDLKSLLNNIISLSNSLKTPIGTPQPYVPNTNILTPAIQTSLTARRMLNSIESYKSKTSKTK